MMGDIKSDTAENAVADWVQAAQAGDSAAFGELVERYQGAIFAQCRRLAANRADAEDLTHDTFVQAFTQIAQLRQPERFGGWLKTIMLNIYRSHLRRQYPPMMALEADALASDDRGDRGNMDDEQWLQVEKNLWRLSPPQRLVLALHYWEGLSYEEIAHFAGVPLGTVMSRLHRARRNLKDGTESELEKSEAEMKSTPDLRKEIDAEIEALGRLFAEDRESMERLSVLLHRAPARFAHLIEEMVSSDELDALVMLLQRLGAPAMAVALDCYWSENQPQSARALALLQALIKKDEDWHWDKKWTDGETLTHVTQTTYALLDQIIARSIPEAEKVELLLLLAQASARHGLIDGLCWKVMLSYSDAAFVLLCEKLAALEDPSVQMPPVEMNLLVRFGTRGCRQIIAWLDSEVESERHLGLVGLVSLAGRINPRVGGGVAAEAEMGRDKRFYDGWHLLNEDIDSAVLHAILTRSAVLTQSADDDEARFAALAVLGALRRADEQVINALVCCLKHDERETRLATLNALGEIGLTNRGLAELAPVEEAIVVLLENENCVEQAAALTALGRLHFESARATLTHWAENATHVDVREAAINGLGQIGGRESEDLLRQLQVSGSKELRKRATRWLQRLQKNRAKEIDQTAEISAAKRAKDKRIARFRGELAEDVAFPFNRLHINLGAAVRSLPEAREYPEMELTRYFAQVCVDYSFTRRVLADRGVLHRQEGMCSLTESGLRVWRVEHFIRERYLGGPPA